MEAGSLERVPITSIKKGELRDFVDKIKPLNENSLFWQFQPEDFYRIVIEL
jgi:hypothetical protein